MTPEAFARLTAAVRRYQAAGEPGGAGPLLERCLRAIAVERNAHTETVVSMSQALQQARRGEEPDDDEADADREEIAGRLYSAMAHACQWPDDEAHAWRNADRAPYRAMADTVLEMQAQAEDPEILLDAIQDLRKTIRMAAADVCVPLNAIRLPIEALGRALVKPPEPPVTVTVAPGVCGTCGRGAP